MIDWIHSLCGEWGAVKRNRLWASGFPPESTIYQLLSGRGGFRQFLPEVMMSEDVRACDRAIALMGEQMPIEHKIIWGTYVFRKGQRSLGRVLELQPYEVRQHLGVAHGFLSAKIEVRRTA